jgi:cytochrome c-type biogenesis protein CcmE
MSKGPVITGVVTLLAMAAVVGAFLNNANPYVESVAQARESKESQMHLAGDIVKGSVQQDLRSGQVSFRLRDSHGEEIEVLNLGDPPANMGDATKVVAVGSVKNGVFESKRLLIKCPSKYEAQERSVKTS